ncbi:hypothetical protein NPIL_510331 [Nephila pilipes]|uniref:Uncharacterized protein n=1 Tax=Nephila pilipes TaxID=299642 RepID=A0A8X6QDM1_NEPPI|nr:hypothetical protein NPIL_510331 [Nephila pilipes]
MQSYISGVFQQPELVSYVQKTRKTPRTFRMIAIENEVDAVLAGISEEGKRKEKPSCVINGTRGAISSRSARWQGRNDN